MNNSLAAYVHKSLTDLLSSAGNSESTIVGNTCPSGLQVQHNMYHGVCNNGNSAESNPYSRLPESFSGGNSTQSVLTVQPNIHAGVSHNGNSMENNLHRQQTESFSGGNSTQSVLTVQPNIPAGMSYNRSSLENNLHRQQTESFSGGNSTQSVLTVQPNIPAGMSYNRSSLENNLHRRQTGNEPNPFNGPMGNRSLSSYNTSQQTTSFGSAFNLANISNVARKRKRQGLALSAPQPARVAIEPPRKFWIDFIYTTPDNSDCPSVEQHSHVQLEKSFTCAEVTEAIRRSFGTRLPVGDFRLKIKKHGGPADCRGLRDLDINMPVPHGEIVFMKRTLQGGIHVTELEEEDGVYNVSTPPTYSDNTRTRMNALGHDPSPTINSFASPLNTTTNSVTCETLERDTQAAEIEAYENRFSSFSYLEDDLSHGPIEPINQFDGETQGSASTINTDIGLGALVNEVDIIFPGGTGRSRYDTFASNLRIRGANDVEIHREELMKESITLLSCDSYDPFKSPRVKFISELGVDAGGLRKSLMYDFTQKLMSSSYNGKYLFDGAMGNKLPTGDDVSASVFTAIAKFAMTCMIYGPQALPGLSPLFVQFLLSEKLNSDMDLSWTENDLTLEARINVELCKKSLIMSSLDTEDALTMRRLAMKHNLWPLASSAKVEKLLKRIVFSDVFVQRIKPLTIFKEKFEAYGINQFLRDNKDCVEFMFPRFVEIPIHILLEKLSITETDRNKPAYNTETMTKYFISSYLVRNEKEPHVIRNLLRAWTGTGDPPGNDDSLYIKCCDQVCFRTCTTTLEVYNSIQEEDLLLYLKLAGEDDYPFDAA